MSMHNDYVVVEVPVERSNHSWYSHDNIPMITCTTTTSFSGPAVRPSSHRVARRLYRHGEHFAHRGVYYRVTGTAVAVDRSTSIYDYLASGAITQVQYDADVLYNRENVFVLHRDVVDTITRQHIDPAETSNLTVNPVIAADIISDGPVRTRCTIGNTVHTAWQQWIQDHVEGHTVKFGVSNDDLRDVLLQSSEYIAPLDTFWIPSVSGAKKSSMMDRSIANLYHAGVCAHRYMATVSISP